MAGLPRSYKVYTSGDGSKRTAVVINNDRLNVTLITQLSNEEVFYVMNEATETPTFQSKRGSSRIDLTITNSKLVRFVSDWTCGEEESCSDHNIVNFKIASVYNGKGKMNYTGVRYITNKEDYKTFDTTLASNFISTFNCTNKTDAN